MDIHTTVVLAVS